MSIPKGRLVAEARREDLPSGVIALALSRGDASHFNRLPSDNLVTSMIEVQKSIAEAAALVEQNTLRAGALLAELRLRGWSWRQIYDATGVVQRTAARWIETYLTWEINRDTP